MNLQDTHYFKGRDGYQAETLTETDANGNVWEIRTSKTRGGVYCYAKQGQDEGKGMISYDLFGGKKLENLAQEAGQCNEAKVKRVHEAGLIAFLKHFENEPQLEEKYILGPGQIIFTDWVNREERQVIFETTSPGHFRAVSLDGKQIQNVDRIRPASEKFGIGTYYNEGEKMPLDQVNELVNRAHEIERERTETEAKASAQAATERARKIQEGAQIISAIPEGVQAVIVANLRQDESDHQSDYFNARTIKTVYLAWSAHTKDIFSELRKAAGKFEETAQYSTAPQMPDGEDSKYWTPEDEHREKYTGGHGYYLGKDSYSGWIVRKTNLGQYGPDLEKLQIAAAEGRFLCNEAEAKPERATAPQIEAQPVTAGTIQIVDYSEKAIAVIGDTKPIKDKLKSLGGKFNFRLSCGAGWIFRKADLEKIQKALSKPAPEPIPTAEEIEEPPMTEVEYKAAEAHAENEAARESETINSLAIAANIEEDFTEGKRKQEFCRPTTAPAFFIKQEEPSDSTNGHGTHYTAERERPEVTRRANDYKKLEENGRNLKLYSEHGQGQNTGRAQQGFLF